MFELHQKQRTRLTTFVRITIVQVASFAFQTVELCLAIDFSRMAVCCPSPVPFPVFAASPVDSLSKNPSLRVHVLADCGRIGRRLEITDSP